MALKSIVTCALEVTTIEEKRDLFTITLNE